MKREIICIHSGKLSVEAFIEIAEDAKTYHLE